MQQHGNWFATDVHIADTEYVTGFILIDTVTSTQKYATVEALLLEGRKLLIRNSPL